MLNLDPRPLLLAVLVLFPTGATARNLGHFQALDLPAPQCRGKASLDVSRDFFVELGNDVPGVTDYNELVRLFRRRLWSDFDAKLDIFLKRHGESPLVEAVAFLDAQAAFDKAEENYGPPDPAGAERRFRDALVRYPNSSFVPAAYVSAANFWMQRGLYDKSLALYETAREKFPFHPTACVVLLGVAESKYQLSQFDAAQHTFRLVLQKCRNKRLQVGASVRLADLEFSRSLAKSEPLYLKALQLDRSRFNRFYPHALYNLGEALYRTGRHRNALFYFDEYLKHVPRDSDCVPFALKRLADVALQLGKSEREVAGLYLVARDRAPGLDVGRYSFLRALFLELPGSPAPERERRLKLFDQEAARMDDQAMISRLKLERSVALLEAGEWKAIDELLAAQESGEPAFRDKRFGAFLRRASNAILDAETARVTAKGAEGVADPEALRALERAYPKWLAKHEEGRQARKRFSSLVVGDFSRELGRAEKKDEAFTRLSQWSQSAMWDPTTLAPTEKEIVGKRLFDALYYATDPQHLGLMVTRHEKILRPVVPASYSILWTAAAVALGDSERVKQLLASRGGRGPASLPGSLPAPVRDSGLLVAGRAYASQGRYDEADAVFKRVTKSPYRELALVERLKIYRSRKRFAQAFEVARELFQAAATEKRRERIHELKEIVEQGKLWGSAQQLVALAEKLDLPAEERASYHLLAGKARFERGECRLAVESFEKAFAVAPSAPSHAEARYKLGKCLLTLRQPAAAKKVWEELVRGRDDFWSPMAANELKILAQ